MNNDFVFLDWNSSSPLVPKSKASETVRVNVDKSTLSEWASVALPLIPLAPCAESAVNVKLAALAEFIIPKAEPKIIVKLEM